MFFMSLPGKLLAGLTTLAVIGIITAILSISVCLKVLVVLYMHTAAAPSAITSADWAVSLAGAIIFAFLLWLGLVPALFLSQLSRFVGLFPLP
jgi:NADH:ubiquinone oxidoreductase subunit 2 (subunit N)